MLIGYFQNGNNHFLIHQPKVNDFGIITTHQIFQRSIFAASK
jgi:hypothetical protein